MNHPKAKVTFAPKYDPAAIMNNLWRRIFSLITLRNHLRMLQISLAERFSQQNTSTRLRTWAWRTIGLGWQQRRNNNIANKRRSQPALARPTCQQRRKLNSISLLAAALVTKCRLKRIDWAKAQFTATETKIREDRSIVGAPPLRSSFPGKEEEETLSPELSACVISCLSG